MDRQLAWPVPDAVHRLHAVHHEIYEHLLQLNTITKDRQQVRGQVQPQRHVVATHLGAHQQHDFADHVVDIDPCPLGIRLLRELADPLDDVAGPVAVIHDGG